MNGATLLIVGIIFFLFAYRFYGRYLARLFEIDPGRETPAHTRTDGIDYVPAKFPVLFGHHFASIAGAGPIVGPVLAVYLGWGPVALWVLFGCVFIGAMHDFAALLSSVRNEGRSIGHVIEQHLGYSGRQIFLVFCWSARQRFAAPNRPQKTHRANGHNGAGPIAMGNRPTPDC